MGNISQKKISENKNCSKKIWRLPTFSTFFWHKKSGKNRLGQYFFSTNFSKPSLKELKFHIVNIFQKQISENKICSKPIWVGSTFSSFFRTSKKSKKSIRLIFFLNNFYFLKFFFEKYSPYEIWAPSNWVLKTLLKSEALLRDILSDTTERTVVL